MRKTMKNPDIFREKDACKICKCVVFPEQEIDFIKIENSKKCVFRRKFDPKSCSKRRCSNHRKIIKKWCQNGIKIHPKSMKNPSKNRGPKKDGPKSRKIEAWGAQGSKMSLRPSCGPRDFEPVGPYKPTKRTRIVFRWSHTPMGRWPGELFLIKNCMRIDHWRSQGRQRRN